MDFAARRQEAIERVRKELRKELPADLVLIHAWRCAEARPKALEHWLFAVLPDMHPDGARDAVAKNGSDAWDENGRGAAMSPDEWKALQQVCTNRKVNLDKLADRAGKNLYTLLGSLAMAELLEAAGGIQQLARMTQRDCMILGSERQIAGEPRRKSILERHELTKNDRSLRVLASRVVLAARLDVYKGMFKGESLKQEVLYAQ